MEFAAGFLIALAIGLTGVGGGVITAPVLILYAGLPAPVAVGTALVFVTLVKSLAATVYVRRRQVNWRVLRYMLAGGAPGALAGALLLRYAAHRDLDNLVLAAVGLVVATSSVLSLLRLLRRREPAIRAERPRTLAALSAAIGFEVGFSSAGAGALGTLALFRFTNLAPMEVVGTDLLFGFAVALIGGGFHLAGGTVDTAVLLKLAAGGAFGVLAGARMAAVLPSRVLRAGISVLLAALGSQLCLRGISAILGR